MRDGARCCGIWRRLGRWTCCGFAAGSASRTEALADPAAVVSREADPSQEAEAVELAERLRAALAQLPPRPGEVFCLSCLDKLSYREIGGRLGLTTNAVGRAAAPRPWAIAGTVGPGRCEVGQRRLRVGQVEDRRDEQFDDLLDRATEALRRAPVPRARRRKRLPACCESACLPGEQTLIPS